MAIELDHSQVTQEQIDLWLLSPVSVAYLKCLEWERLDLRDRAGEGGFVDSSSADLTHGLMHSAMGQQEALTRAHDVIGTLDKRGLIFHPPPKKEDENDE